MKKMVFTLALLLMSLSAAVAQTGTFKITNAVARNSKVNQMYVTTKSGDVKYYNTADLTSVKFEDDKAIIAPKSGSENDEYDAAKEAQAHLEDKINRLKLTIAEAKIIDTKQLSTDSVQIIISR